MIAHYAILLAAGSSTRMNSSIHKLFHKISGFTSLERLIKIFTESDFFEKIVIVTRQEDYEFIAGVTQDQPNIICTIGGYDRFSSVTNGVQTLGNLPNAEDIILIHNVANPIIDSHLISQVLMSAKTYGASACGVKCIEAIRGIKHDYLIDKGDGDFARLQTPQATNHANLIKAIQYAKINKISRKDETGLLANIGIKTRLVTCGHDNIKLTYPPDLDLAHNLMTQKRVGFGMDSHWFHPKHYPKPLILGGVELASTGGFKARSDGDVFIHALVNALAQALSLPSIGELTDQWQVSDHHDSRLFLEKTLDIMLSKSLTIDHIGFMYESINPNISHYRTSITQNLAHLTSIATDKIAIIATSGEHIHAFGHGKAAQCFCLIQLKPNHSSHENLSH